MNRALSHNSLHLASAKSTGQIMPLCRLVAGLVLVLRLLYSPDFACGEGFVTEDPYKVEAAFLRNFAHYVTWPASAFADVRSPWRIGILGRDPFGEVLEKTFRGRTEQGRTFEIFRAETLDELPPCQIIFIAYKDVAKRRAALIKLKNRPVLTVGDASGFLREGGIIRFQVGDYVGMSINLDQARFVSLKIPTKMLEVTREVVENGAVRRLR